MLTIQNIVRSLLLERLNLHSIGKTEIFDHYPPLASIRFHVRIQHVEVGWNLRNEVFEVFVLKLGFVQPNDEKFVEYEFGALFEFFGWLVSVDL